MDHATYRNRHDAGRRLADDLSNFSGDANAVVLALPRGGVPVAFEVATRLHLPLDVYVVRKLGIPGHDELAMGAIAGDGGYVIDRRLVEELGVPQDALAAVIHREIAELRRRQAAYRDGRPDRDLTGKTVILVDDGLATGSSMYAAVEAVREKRPASVVVAVPVGSEEACSALRRRADSVICSFTPHYFGAVGMYYADFTQTGDDEVRALLNHAAVLEANRWKVA